MAGANYQAANGALQSQSADAIGRAIVSAFSKPGGVRGDAGMALPAAAPAPAPAAMAPAVAAAVQAARPAAPAAVGAPAALPYYTANAIGDDGQMHTIRAVTGRDPHGLTAAQLDAIQPNNTMVDQAQAKALSPRDLLASAVSRILSGPVSAGMIAHLAPAVVDAVPPVRTNAAQESILAQGGAAAQAIFQSDLQAAGNDATKQAKALTNLYANSAGLVNNNPLNTAIANSIQLQQPTQ